MDEIVPREIVTEPPNDKQAPWLYVVSVVFLGVVGVICTAGAVFLAFNGKDVPEALLPTAATALALLGGLLARGK